MGGMGRVFDGGYAEYTVVPRGQVIPFTSDLPWEVIGAVPETLQTAYGSLTTGLDLFAGPDPAGARRHVLGRARRRDHRRQGPRRDRARHHPPARPRPVAARPRRRPCPRRRRPDRRPGARPARRRCRRRPRAGRHADPARHAARHPRPRHRVLHRDAVEPVDRAGLLPDRLPPHRRPTHRVRRRQRRPAAAVLQHYLDRLADGTASLGPIRVHRLEDIREAHLDLEHNRTFGKHVVLAS